MNLRQINGLVLIAISMITFTNFSCSTKSKNEDSLKIWYNQPAKVIENEKQNSEREWLKALPLGNGSLGLMVFGDVNRERIQLNEETMWSGSPTDNDNPDAHKELKNIRNFLFDGKYREATELTNKTQICKGVGSRPFGPFGSFGTMGDLWIDNAKKSDYQNYRRELDFEDAVVRISYTQDGVDFSREIFTSYPDQVMVARFSANKPGMISFTCKMNRPERFTTFTESEQLVMLGALPNGKDGDGLHYMTRLKAANKKGTVSCSDSTLIIENADEVILFLSASTDYILKYPEYNGRDYEKITATYIENAVKKSYNDLLKRNLDEYRPYFKRLSFDITKGQVEKIPTDVRIKNFKETKTDPHLVELIFQYGRYLLISSSRPGTMPANLQGLWADGIRCPWNGDYHTDINVQMNYWLAEVTNLSEMHLPLFDLIESLMEPGRKTASVQYHLNGWVVHPITNVWGFTAPGEKASWGMHLGAGAWLCSHILERYSFTGDKNFLKRMYPAMKGSVEFYLDWLVENPVTGKLVSGPAVSPENTFVAPDGSQSQICMGPAHDQQVIWQLFTDFISVSKELKMEDEIVKLVIEARENLAGPEIGSDGRLMEWPEEFPEVEPGHRHISHLFALHPGSQISIEKTPELAAAAKKSLDYRIEHGGGHTGWSAAWLISQYARLYEAEKALENLNTVLSRSVAPNLFGLHPPFQIDGNFGTTAGIAEMLIQSHAGKIHLLPALPNAWPNGKVKGLKARGGYELDIEWENNELTRVRIKSDNQNEAQIRFKGNTLKVYMKKGEVSTIRISDF
jgi:alpha-L-fucosidase 2